MTCITFSIWKSEQRSGPYLLDGSLGFHLQYLACKRLLGKYLNCALWGRTILLSHPGLTQCVCGLRRPMVLDPHGAKMRPPCEAPKKNESKSKHEHHSGPPTVEHLVSNGLLARRKSSTPEIKVRNQVKKRPCGQTNIFSKQAGEPAEDRMIWIPSVI